MTAPLNPETVAAAVAWLAEDEFETSDTIRGLILAGRLTPEQVDDAQFHLEAAVNE